MTQKRNLLLWLCLVILAASLFFAVLSSDAEGAPGDDQAFYQIILENEKSVWLLCEGLPAPGYFDVRVHGSNWLVIQCLGSPRGAE